MAGILNSKERFMDFQLTPYGRKQLAKGDLNFSFAVLSDRGTFYSRNSSDVLAASQSTSRICFEVFSKSQDQIYVEPEPDGSIYFQTGSLTYDSEVFYVTSGSTVTQVGNVLSGSDLIYSGTNALLDATESGFKALQPLKRRLKNNQKFSLDKNKFNFVINRNSPIDHVGEPTFVNIDNLESFHQDFKLSELPNYELLPPQNIITKRKLRDYVDTRQARPKNIQEFFEKIGVTGKVGKVSKKQFVDVQFKGMSDANNIAMQVLEATSETIGKLVMIDYGKIDDINPFLPGRHIVFVGKILRKPKDKMKSEGMGPSLENLQNLLLLDSEDVFVNIFTLVFD